MNKIYNLLTLCLLFCCVGQANAQVSTSPPAGASAATVTNYFGPVTYVSTTNVVVAGSTMTKTAGGNPNWDGGGVAQQNVWSGGYVEARCGQTGTHMMFGLNADASADNSYCSIDYAMYFNAGTACVYENCGSPNCNGIAYTTGDVFRVQWNASTNRIDYMKNGVTFYTSGVVPNLTYKPDMSLYEIGSSLDNFVVFGGNTASIGSNQLTITVPAPTSGCYGYGFQYTNQANGYGIITGAFAPGSSSFGNSAGSKYWGTASPVISTGTNGNVSGKVTFTMATLNPGCLATAFTTPTLTLNIKSPAGAYWVNDGNNIYVPLSFGTVTYTVDVNLGDGLPVNGGTANHFLNNCNSYSTYTSLTEGWVNYSPSILSGISGTTAICSGGTAQLSATPIVSSYTGSSSNNVAGGYRVYSLTSSGTLNFSNGGNVEALVVGGGGSGGGSQGTSIASGGGGAGGVSYNSKLAVSGSIAVTVGGGGVGQVGFVNGQNGGDFRHLAVYLLQEVALEVLGQFRHQVVDREVAPVKTDRILALRRLMELALEMRVEMIIHIIATDKVQEAVAVACQAARAQL